MRYGSKQDMHIITRGMLGDAMKQILAFGYILIHVNDDGTTFEDQQWKHPLIIRHNRREYKILLNVVKIRQYGTVTIDESQDVTIESPDTEIELVLPIIDEVRNGLDKQSITDFSRKYPIFTTDLTFRFEVTDTSTPPNHVTHDTEEEVDTEADEDAKDSEEVDKERVILNAIGDGGGLESPMATTKIQYRCVTSDIFRGLEQTE